MANKKTYTRKTKRGYCSIVFSTNATVVPNEFNTLKHLARMSLNAYSSCPLDLVFCSRNKFFKGARDIEGSQPLYFKAVKTTIKNNVTKVSELCIAEFSRGGKELISITDVFDKQLCENIEDSTFTKSCKDFVLRDYDF